MKTFKRFVAFGLTLSIIMCSTAASTFASESTQGRASNSTEVHDFLVSGLAAAEAVSEFEDTTKLNLVLKIFQILISLMIGRRMRKLSSMITSLQEVYIE